MCRGRCARVCVRPCVHVDCRIVSLASVRGEGAGSFARSLSRNWAHTDALDLIAEFVEVCLQTLRLHRRQLGLMTTHINSPPPHTRTYKKNTPRAESQKLCAYGGIQDATAPRGPARRRRCEGNGRPDGNLHLVEAFQQALLCVGHGATRQIAACKRRRDLQS